MADVFEYQSELAGLPKLSFPTPKIRLKGVTRFILGILKPAIRMFGDEIKRQLFIAVDWIYDNMPSREEAKAMVEKLVDNAVDQV